MASSPSDPNRFDPLIEKWIKRWSTTYGVAIPIPLVKAIIAVESSFRPGASLKEKDGEFSRGLMMVKDSTAKDLGLANPELLFDPDVAIQYGVKYLAQKIRNYGAISIEAIAAYNAGSVRRTRTGELINAEYVQKVVDQVKRFSAAAAPAVWVFPAALVGGLMALLFRSRGK
jgi:soluble lytic murein transglycosylase-like protein